LIVHLTLGSESISSADSRFLLLQRTTIEGDSSHGRWAAQPYTTKQSDSLKGIFQNKVLYNRKYYFYGDECGRYNPVSPPVAGGKPAKEGQ